MVGMGIVRQILALLYGRVVALRGWLYDKKVFKSYRSPIPVISVGNITAGGNGKTPLCLAVAQELLNRGYSPAILSRGYGGSCRGPRRVSTADTCREVGDEAVLMAQSGIPVFIARKRVAGMKLIEQDSAIHVVILDDGFQHRALARSLDIVSVFVGTTKAIDEFKAGRLLPAGMFREERGAALRRAQMVVLSYRTVQEAGKREEVGKEFLELIPPSSAVFRAFLLPSEVTSLNGERTYASQEICAFAAIANPEGFFRSLETLGFTIRERFAFRDHHIFIEAELERILLEYPDLLFVCTEKDAVKLRELAPEIGNRIGVLGVKAQIVPSDAFFVQVERAIQADRSEVYPQKFSRL